MKRKQRLPGFLERIPKIRAIGKRAQTAFRKACERIGVQPQQLIFEAVNLGLINPKGTKIFFEGKYAAATTLQIYAFLLARAREGAERSVIVFAPGKKPRPMYGIARILTGTSFMPAYLIYNYFTNTKRTLTAKTASTLELELIEIFQKFGL